MKKNLVLIIVWVLIFIFSFFITFDIGSNFHHEQDILKISSVLTDKINKAKSIINKEFNIFKFNGLTGLHEKQNIKFLENESKKNIYFACYKGDSAIFWSKADFIPLLLPKKSSSNVYYVNSTWSYVLKKKYQDYTLVTFIPIKKDYPLINNYIQNYFYPDFDVNYDYSLSLVPQTSAYYVTDSNGQFIFSLTPTTPNYSILLTWVMLIFLFLIFMLLQHLLINSHSKQFFLFAFLGVLLVRIFMILYKQPSLIYNLSIFKAYIFASTGIFSTLGDAFFNSWLILIFAEWILIKLKRKIVNNKLFFVLLSTIAISSLIILSFISNKLVFQSSIKFEIFNISTIIQPAILAYIIIGIWIWISARFIFFTIKFLIKNKNIRWLWFLVLSEILFFIFFLFHNNYEHFSWLIFLIFCVLLYFMPNKPIYKIPTIVISAAIFSSFIVLYVYYLNAKKKESIRKVVAFSLSHEKDYVAQMLLSDMEKKLAEDKILQRLIKKQYDTRYEIYHYLKDNYFYGFWNKYDLQVTICNSLDNLRLMPSYESCGCFDFFNKLIKTKGSYINSKYFYSIENDYGNISYLGIFTYPFSEYSDSVEKKIFLELYQKLLPNTPGYPDLLVDAKTYNSLSKQWSNYAKYKSNKLIQKNGNFNYPYYNIFTNSSNKTITYQNFEHYTYNPNKKLTIIVSNPVIKWHQYLWSIVYIFNFFILIFFIPYGFYFYFKNKNNFLYGFRFKYISSFILVLISSYIIIGLYTMLYFNKQYQQKNIEALSQKQKTIINALNEYLGSFENLTHKTNHELNKQLVTLSNIFFSDINIYDTKGYLKATSRPALFEKGFVGKLINAEALSSIIRYNNEYFINEEKIGKLSYLSSYNSLYSNGKLQGILQLPYFTEKEKNQKEIAQVLFSLTNIYILFIALSFFIILLIANGILKPLLLLQNYFSKIKPNQEIKPIYYNQKDEIAPLVDEYNRVLEELSKSTRKLLESEREATWRDIARQIAHEIKNPLTPMKLNIQYLIKVKNEKGQVPEEMFNKTMNTLMEQIESLSTIASAFSTFANMPKPNIEIVNLNEIISYSVHLFSGQDFHIQVKNEQTNYLIEGDKEYFKRIFTNLLTNAIQAIPSDRVKKISISAEKKQNIIVIKVSDNGIGISNEIADKIFKPSFTTKSSGMGMGLSMVKTMVEAMNGNIYFESKEGVGTSFIMEFPSYE